MTSNNKFLCVIKKNCKCWIRNFVWFFFLKGFSIRQLLRQSQWDNIRLPNIVLIGVSNYRSKKRKRNEIRNNCYDPIKLENYYYNWAVCALRSLSHLFLLVNTARWISSVESKGKRQKEQTNKPIKSKGKNKTHQNSKHNNTNKH